MKVNYGINENPGLKIGKSLESFVPGGEGRKGGLGGDLAGGRDQELLQGQLQLYSDHRKMHSCQGASAQGLQPAGNFVSLL